MDINKIIIIDSVGEVEDDEWLHADTFAVTYTRQCNCNELGEYISEAQSLPVSPVQTYVKEWKMLV
jgi:hypothetical protein